MEPFFQVGIIVQDLDRAMRELSEARDIHWGEVVARKFDKWEFRRVFSREGPPYIELVEGPPGSPWDASNGPRIDHLQWWTDDMEADTQKAEGAGLTLDTDGKKLGGPFRYFRSSVFGGRIELIDSTVRAGHRKRWGIEEPGAGEDETAP